MFRQIHHSRAVRAVFGFGLAALTFGMVSAGVVTEAAPVATATPAAAAAQAEIAPAVDVVSRVGPAVVTVVNEQQYQMGAETGVQPVGSGTGFVIDNDGHIVTNWHVVNGGDKFFVIFSDGTKRDATLVGSDEVSDLAVVQVTGKVPATVGFGDSSALKPGEPVLAIGSPLGAFSNTVTEGIIGATGRNFPYSSGGPQVYDDLIQHDAAINPGNSGGPLLDLEGNVIGVNTLGIPTDDQGQPVQGLFFAIPSNTVKTIVTQLIASGKITYPFFGITPVGLDPVAAAANNLPVDSGAYVAQVASGSPAASAGIQEGDIVLAIAGTKINQQNSFTEALFPHKPGEQVSVDLQRGDQQLSVKVTLGERAASTSESNG
ncbi:MAG TPA: trypsin-like peptidase domain-containing protein [Thermomicrobiales bacterium]|nr:trypsin-like peptidase domain-containing protein [Thermomicrobiales bacterium]